MSEVWNHFYMAPNGLSVNCNHCGKFMKRSDSSTKSMWGHLKAFHSDLVGEETFRLKRTRRMRGENNGDSKKKSKSSRQKKPKIENLENNTECQNSQNSNSSSCSSNISENNSSEEEGEENIKNSVGFEYCSSGNSGSNTPLFAEGKRQMIKEEENEEGKHFEVNSALERGKQPMGTALSIQTLLKLEENEDGMKCPQSVGENAEQKFELSHQQLVQLSTLQNQQNLINNQNLLFGLPTSSTPSITSSLSSSSTSPPNFPVRTIPSNIQKSPPNTPSLTKYSTAALLQNQQQQKEGKLSPAHGSEAPQQAINNLNFEMTRQQNLPFDPQILARLETAAAINQLSQLQQLETSAMLQQLQQRSIQTNEQHVLQQQTLNEMFALFASEAFQQQNQNFPSTNINQNFQQQQAFATWLCNLEWMAAVQRAQQQQQQTSLKQSEQEINKHCLDEHVLNGNKNNLTTKTSKTNISQQNISQQNINSSLQTFQQQQTTSETFAAALQQVLFPQTQFEQQMNKQCFSDLNKHATTTKTHQKRKSGLTSATLLATPTPSTSEPPSTPLQVLAETASSLNNKMFPNISTNDSQPSLPKAPRQENFTLKQQQLINEHHLAESLAESLVLYGMHRIAMDLQLSYSVQANKQGKAEYAFYKNSGGIST
ncbi:unnamed protein product [Meloidogyne enterolobii]|uniref:Uncharacterized protein n=1 Tax=Meloidogyne enterolobii TaxID=390850 RepID=A0ACB1AVV1_MELEN